MIFAYWRYTDFSRTMLAERGELYMEQNLPPLPPVIFENGLYYELRGEQYGVVHCKCSRKSPKNLLN